MLKYLLLFLLFDEFRYRIIQISFQKLEHKILLYSKKLLCKSNWKFLKPSEFCIRSFVNLDPGKIELKCECHNTYSIINNWRLNETLKYTSVIKLTTKHKVMWIQYKSFISESCSSLEVATITELPLKLA
jgi:hypothetical protein